MIDGVLDLVTFALALVFAAPVALLGLFMLSTGDLVVGVVFLAIAAGMLAVERWLTTPRDLPMIVLQRVTGRVVTDADDEESQ